jgi:uncharacterized delta-60 repeat protein
VSLVRSRHGSRALSGLIVCGLVLALATAALAAAGQLDTSFSGDGKQTTSFGVDQDQAYGIAIQPNGRIVVVGLMEKPSGADFAVARYMPGGGLDASFSGDGRQTIALLPQGLDNAEAVAIQGNGRIVVVGSSDQNATGTDFAVARMMPNGDPDTGFSGDGQRLIGFGNGIRTDEAKDVAIQPNGRIVIAGVSDQAATSDDFAIARLMPNGNLDNSFSGDGRRTLSFGPDSDQGDGLALQPNGRIVVAGFSEPGGGAEADFAVARFLSNGSPDTSFSGDARRTTGFANGAQSDEGEGLALQLDGKIVVAGSSDQGADDDFAVARFTPSGGLDPGFSNDGKRTLGFGPGQFDDPHAVALQGNGRIVLAGETGGSGGSDSADDFAIARLLPNGNPDATFSGDGRRVTSFDNGTAFDVARGVAIQANGRIVVAGETALETNAGTSVDFAVARFLAG